ncbi:hypothetical protein ACKFKG_05935 [Phormidesmis sp. 146-35]
MERCASPADFVLDDIAIVQSQSGHLNGFGVSVKSRAKIAQSHPRRFRRWLSNRGIDAVSAHQALMKQALSEWSNDRMYLIKQANGV